MVVTEIEAMLNDRPLTQLSSCSNYLVPLTPSHLVYGRRITSLPYNDIAIDTENQVGREDGSLYRKRVKQQNEVLNQFWKRWRTEYLTALRESHKLTGTTLQSIAVGDVVQIHDECPRSQWKLGVEQELITGKNGLARAAHVRTTRGVTTRPIVKLYPL